MTCLLCNANKSSYFSEDATCGESMLSRGLFLNHQVFLMADQTCFQHSSGQSHRFLISLPVDQCRYFRWLSGESCCRVYQAVLSSIQKIRSGLSELRCGCKAVCILCQGNAGGAESFRQHDLIMQFETGTRNLKPCT